MSTEPPISAVPLDDYSGATESLSRATAVCVGVALVLVLGMTGWGAYQNYSDTRAALLQSEINRLRSHAIRSTARIRDYVAAAGGPLDWTKLANETWLQLVWNQPPTGQEIRLYTAIVDHAGRIILHSDPSFNGMQLSPNWAERELPQLGEDVAATHDPALTAGREAYDIWVPIIIGTEEVATYHVGFNLERFSEKLAEVSRPVIIRWAVLLVLILAVVLIATWSLRLLVRRAVLLEQSIQLFRVRQLAELGQLAAAIAHEIRNPLNAMRLNLHVVRKLRASSDGHAQETNAILDETDREIERVENLMKMMLGYARPEAARNERIDVVPELERIVTFLRPIMDRDHVDVQLEETPGPTVVTIDRGRFRQIMLNLLNNAREAAGPGGHVEIRVKPEPDDVLVEVADDGPGVPTSLRERIFEPFYSSKDLGTGLGLALVKRFVDEQGGTVTCTGNGVGGAVFQVRLARGNFEPAQPAPAAIGG